MDNNNIQAENTDNQKEKKFNKKTRIAILTVSAIIIIFCIILGGLYFYFAPKAEIISVSPYTEAFAVDIAKNKVSSGYQIEASLSETFDTDVIQKESTGIYITVDELTANETYYVRARTYKEFSGHRIYSFWSDTAQVVPKEKIALKYINAVPSATKVLLKKTISIKTSLIPENTDYKNIQYASSDEKIATVDENGVVTGVGEGDVIITVSVEGTEKSREIKIKVEKPFVKTTGIEISDKKGLSVETGSTIQLHANVLPKDATNQEIVWTVKDETKAKVDAKGVVTALRPTEYLEITAKTKDGKFSAKYVLKVTKTKGFLTTKDLDKLNLSSVDNLMIVAHPDDETLWGGSHLMNARYLVIVMTNSYKSQRASELKKVMNMSNDKYLILSYPDIKDTWSENGKYKYSVDEWSTCSEGMDADIKLILNYKHWKVIATHNPNGEYGHIQHQNISKKVTDIVTKSLSGDQEFYYFGNWYSKKANNPDPKLDDTNYKKKNSLVDVYLPSSPYAIANNRHMVQYENWIKYQDWNNKKSY